MSIVYKEFIKKFNEDKPDWFQSDELKIVFIKSEYIPNKEHKFKDVEQYICSFGSIKITSARIENTEDKTLYYIDNLKNIKTHGGKYMLFIDWNTKGLIFLKDIPLTHESISITFNGPLFIMDRSGNVVFNFPPKGMNFKKGKHKLVIK